MLSFIQDFTKPVLLLQSRSEYDSKTHPVLLLFTQTPISKSSDEYKKQQRRRCAHTDAEDNVHVTPAMFVQRTWSKMCKL